MSKFTFVVEADTITDAKAQVAELYQELHETKTVVTSKPLEPSKAGGQPPKRSKKAKEEAEPTPAAAPEPHDHTEDMEPPVEQPKAVDPFATDEAPTETVEITFQQILDKGKEVSTKKGLPAAQKLVGLFGCEKISAIKKVDYPRFMEEAEKALVS